MPMLFLPKHELRCAVCVGVLLLYRLFSCLRAHKMNFTHIYLRYTLLPCLRCFPSAQAGDHGSESLSHLMGLFVERSHSLWKAQDVQAWLKTAAEAAADVADGKPRSSSSSLPPSISGRVRPAEVEVSGSAQDWACVAAESFPAGGRNEYGHLRLADFSDAVNALPQEDMQAALAPGQVCVFGGERQQACALPNVLLTSASAEVQQDCCNNGCWQVTQQHDMLAGDAAVVQRGGVARQVVEKWQVAR
jgi:hypothetical protein